MDRTFRDKENNSFLVVDGDTVADNRGRRLRLGNINAREIDRLVEGDDGYEFKRGEVGGERQANTLAKIIADGGFNNVEYTGNYDDFDREIINLFNDKGENVETKLISSGAIEVSPYTSEEAIIAKRERELYEAAIGKEKDPINDLGNEIAKEIDQSGLVFKTKAITERFYDPEIHSGVQYRDPSRTIDNQAKGLSGSIATSWDQGWDGVKEGLWGYLDAIGQTTGIKC